MDLERMLDSIAGYSQESFASKNAVLSFGEYLGHLAERPYALTRNAPQYLHDVFAHHGHYEVPGIGGLPVRRWRVFDDPGGDGSLMVFGHEDVQERIHEVVSEFVQRGRADRFILLHGPNGSAKSSIINALVAALERYSRSDDGALYRMSWIFCEGEDRSAVGFGPSRPLDELDTYAHVNERLITCRIPCETKDPPFFLIPKRKRRELLDAALASDGEETRRRFQWTDHAARGDLSPKNKAIYECLLKAYEGDWRKVVKHVRVERYYLSHRYRVGAVTIEPQATIDAGARLLSHGSLKGLPPVLQHETLVEASGDLVDANTGLAEYGDFLKRNIEANKYLLTTAERGFLNLPSATIQLNLVLFGTTNEKYFSAFKRDPSFGSFKGRFELVRVPYLREYGKEQLIYDRHLELVSGDRHVAPHTAMLAALWAVLTRLRRVSAGRWQGNMGRILRRLTPLQKANLYDTGRLPPGLDDDDRHELRASIGEIVEDTVGEEEEFEGFVDAAYEGRRGASAREMMQLLTEVAVSSEADCMGPLQLFEILPRIVEDRTLYSFLRVPEDGGYHDPEAFIETIRTEYVRLAADEVQRAADLVAEGEYLRLFQDYLNHVRASETHERVRNPRTGEQEPPDESLMKEVEEHLDLDGDASDYRSTLSGKAAAWRLSHGDQPLVVESLFQDQIRALERAYFRERRGRIATLVTDALTVFGGGGDELMQDRRQAAANLLGRLQADFGYCPECMAGMLAWVRSHGDRLEDDA